MVMVLVFGALVRILPGHYISAMHLFICFFVTGFVRKNKMVEDRVDSLLSNNSVEIKVDRSLLIVVFRRKLENLLLVIAVYSYNAIKVISKHLQII